MAAEVETTLFDREATTMSHPESASPRVSEQTREQSINEHIPIGKQRRKELKKRQHDSNLPKSRSVRIQYED